MQIQQGLCLILLVCFSTISLNKGVMGTPIIVTVQTQSQQQLDELTAAIEADSQILAGESGFTQSSGRWSGSTRVWVRSRGPYENVRERMTKNVQ